MLRDAVDRLARPATPATLGFVRVVTFSTLLLAACSPSVPLIEEWPALRIAVLALLVPAALGVRTRVFVVLGWVASGVLVGAGGAKAATVIPSFAAIGLALSGHAGNGWAVERLVTLLRAEPVPDPDRASADVGRWLFRTRLLALVGAAVTLGLELPFGGADRAAWLRSLPMLLVFVDVPTLLRRAGLAFRRVRGPVHVLYDGKCPVCRRSQRFLRALDLFARLEFHDFRRLDVAAHAAEHGVSITAEALEKEMAAHREGRLRTGFLAARSLAWSLPALWPFVPFLYLPGAGRAGRALYAWVALNRMRL